LVTSVRLYRHGVEEAFAVGALVLMAFAVGYVAHDRIGLDGETATACVEVFIAAGAFALFSRFGSLAMALGGVGALACLPFTLFDGALMPRAFLAGMLSLGVVAAWMLERAQARVFRREEFSILSALMMLGVCLAVNLRLPDLRPWGYGHTMTPHAGVLPLVYWATYVLTFAIPLMGLVIGIRARRRPLLIASTVGIIVALCTNKDYLGVRHHVWDPMMLGALMIGVAVALERFLKTERNGYTAKAMLIPASDGVESAALLAGAVGTASSGSGPSSGSSGASYGGGSSGGGGASGGY
jgi:uncharacterized membrane protein YgcG